MTRKRAERIARAVQRLRVGLTSHDLTQGELLFLRGYKPAADGYGAHTHRYERAYELVAATRRLDAAGYGSLLQ